ncbi:MAG: DAK2 domain-containing protein [Actinobacteria bacterium]|nr:DAK2 domain-containing protein [Actinomycetota bacterium]
MATLERFSPDALRKTVITFRDAMKAHAAGINRLNVYPVPDGDTGTNMARTLDAVVAELDDADHALEPTCNAISHGSLMGARGNSGVILSQILRGIAATLKEATEGTALKVAESLKAASAAAYLSVLRPIEGTILTVVRESADAAHAAAHEGESLVGVLRAARVAGKSALDRTPDMLPVLKDAGVVDAGGAGFMLLLDAALNVVDGVPIPEPEDIEGPSAEQLEAAAHRHNSSGVDVSELRYEVMYFLDLDDAKIQDFKEGWGEIGDSIVVVGGDGLWNCHVHTNDIGAAVEVALDLGGRPKQIRITDLFEEMEQLGGEAHAGREAALSAAPGAGREHGHAPRAGAGLPPVTCAIVAVSSGDGISELFGQLGVQGVVVGGQTLNPSTAELLSAVEAVNAAQVIVLPNNKNIIPVAQQLNDLTSKQVVVVPTKSMPEALVSLVVYDPEADAVVNAEAMNEATASLITGEVTQAVRNSASEAGPINEGDWIGIARGAGIVAVSGTLDGATVALLEVLVEPGREIVTIVEGLDATAGHTDVMHAWLDEHRPDVQVEVHRGGQPLYPYLFGVE